MFVTRRRLYIVTAYRANDSFGLSGSVFVGRMLRKIIFISAGRAFVPMSRRVFHQVCSVNVITRSGNDYRLAYLGRSVLVREQFVACRARPVRLRAVFNAGGLHSVRFDESVRRNFAALESRRAICSAGAGLIIYRLCGAGSLSDEIFCIGNFLIEYVTCYFTVLERHTQDL